MSSWNVLIDLMFGHYFILEIKNFLITLRGIPAKCRLLKVVDFEDYPVWKMPKNLGNFIHLKYISYRNSGPRINVPKSIGMLQNLETLDIKGNVSELPKEISKLRKLRHLIGTALSLIKLKDCIGEMTSLQTLHNVNLGMDGAVEIIKGLGKLKQIRDLGLLNVSTEDYNILSTSINEMQHLEKLDVRSRFNDNEHTDLNLISSPTMLRKLRLEVWLNKFPEWMLDLQNLTVLELRCPTLTKDPLQSLKSLQHLLILFLDLNKYEGLRLHFQDGEFQKLKELKVGPSNELREIIIEKGALPSLNKLQIFRLYQLESIPAGIQHLHKLEIFHIRHAEVEFVQRISTEEYWNWIMEHVSLVKIYTTDGKVTRNSRS